MSEFQWVHIKNKDELQAFYLSVMDKIRAAAKECGYAIGVHGSLRRDLDLIAIPWVDQHTDRDELAVKIHQAACGLQRQTYEWEEKPQGRVATSMPICWVDWDHYAEKSTGHIDLSIMPGDADR